MATFDDIARMRAALMAEKRQRMAQHPQQVAGAVGQAQGALAALAEQLQRQGIARDRITAANARAEADRKQRAAVEAAKAKAAAEKARLDREARERAGQADLDWKRERFGEEQRIDPDAQRMRGFAVSERIAPPPPGDDDMPDGDDDLATPDERMRALLPDDRYDLRAFQQAEEDRRRKLEGEDLDRDKTRADIRYKTSQADDLERKRGASARAGATKDRDRKSFSTVEEGGEWSSRGVSPGGLGGTVSPLGSKDNRKMAVTREVQGYPFNENAGFISKYNDAFRLLDEVKTSKFKVRWNQATQEWFGVQDPALAKLTGVLVELRDKPSRDKSGAVIGDVEQKSLARIFGGEELDEATLRSLLGQARGWAVGVDFNMRQQAALGGMILPNAPYDPRPLMVGSVKKGW